MEEGGSVDEGSEEKGGEEAQGRGGEDEEVRAPGARVRRQMVTNEGKSDDMKQPIGYKIYSSSFIPNKLVCNEGRWVRDSVGGARCGKHCRYLQRLL